MRSRPSGKRLASNPLLAKGYALLAPGGPAEKLAPVPTSTLRPGRKGR